MITSNKLLEAYGSFQTDGSLRYESYRQRFIDNICAACSALIQYGKKKVIPEFIPYEAELYKYAVMLKITALCKDDNRGILITHHQTPEMIYEMVIEIIALLC